tara:strand:- start:4349 stop:4603 length:255 start_codon:yes stop_codon:yes gene_type:complete
MTNVWILERKNNRADTFYEISKEDFTSLTATEIDFSIWNVENDRDLEKDETTLTFEDAVEYAAQDAISIHVFNSRKQLNKFRGV